MLQLPTPIRAALGLAATAVAEARKLPETLPQLPVAAISTAMQTSLRVQQHIATLAARGDEVISQLRGTSTEAPSWATFDDAPADTRAAFDRVSDELDQLGMTSDLAAPDDLAGTNDLAAPDVLAGRGNTTAGAAEPAHPIDQLTDGEVATPAGDAVLAGASASDRTQAKKAPATKAPATKAPATKAPAKKAPGTKAPAKKAEPLAEAAKKADPDGPPTPSTMAAEILHAHQLEDLPGAPETGEPTE